MKNIWIVLHYQPIPMQYQNISDCIINEFIFNNTGKSWVTLKLKFIKKQRQHTKNWFYKKFKYFTFYRNICNMYCISSLIFDKIVVNQDIDRNKDDLWKFVQSKYSYFFTWKVLYFIGTSISVNCRIIGLKKVWLTFLFKDRQTDGRSDS